MALRTDAAIVNHGRRWCSIATAETDEGLYLPGTKLQLQFQLQGSKAFEPLAATVVKRFEPITVGTVLLVQRHSDNEKVILKLADRRLGYRSNNKGVDTMPWTSSIDGHLRRAVRDIQTGAIPNWFELINDSDNQPDEELWEDWMFEVGTWLGKMDCYDTELTSIDFCIDCKSTPLHPITDVVEGLALEYIPGVSMENLKPGIDVSEQEAERISSEVLEGLRAIEAENCLLHNDVHTRNVVVPEGNRSAVIIDFGQAIIRTERSDEEWLSVVHGGADTRFMRRNLMDPEYGGWKKTVTPFNMSNWHYKEPLAFNKYVESMPGKGQERKWTSGVSNRGFADPTMTTIKPTDTSACTRNNDGWMWEYRPGFGIRIPVSQTTCVPVALLRIHTTFTGYLQLFIPPISIFPDTRLCVYLISLMHNLVDIALYQPDSPYHTMVDIATRPSYRPS
ncbi:hypothetical protein EV421DRAFT_1903608 [Armillaria borealis]|uniref:Aminoglycoside phosphotransferase domain-containing protein n=1 Tax=Armillaria borealis TaxID=47425 RepID=A0AA39JJZ0_9AGAR|nr:hypothetical protein EV421DRAFT_1903608 [Armillaria borealis]